ncbi:MAG: choice-of-anchor tandem repeat NxxGxxAF-containing protein [Planctomycetota bacterium]
MPLSCRRRRDSDAHITPGADASGGLRTVALTGQPTPGQEAWSAFYRFYFPHGLGEGFYNCPSAKPGPTLNDLGQTAFSADWGGSLDSGIAGGRGVWSEGYTGSLRLVDRVDFDTSPYSRDIPNFAISNSGGLAWVHENHLMIDIGEESPLEINPNEHMAPDFDPPYEIRAAGWLEGARPVFAADGSVAFAGTTPWLRPPSLGALTGTGLYRYTPGVGVDIVIEGLESVDGVAEWGDIRATAGAHSGPVVAQLGHNGAQLVTSVGPNTHVAAAVGEIAPGTDGREFTFLNASTINQSGDIAFRGEVDGAHGVWTVAAGGEPSLVVSTDHTVPGDEFRFANEFRDFDYPVMNDHGQVAFWGVVGGATKPNTVWKTSRQGTLELVMASDDLVSWLPEGVFAGVHYSPAINNAGQAVFGVGVWGRVTTGFGLWAETVDGDLVNVVQEGELLDVSDDPSSPDLREVTSIGFSREGFNDRGEVAFYATFLDGTEGVFVSSVAAAPLSGVAGDYNNDGLVDAADFTVWRDAHSAGVEWLANETASPGVTDVADYAAWKAAFAAAASPAGVPEPAAWLTVMACGLTVSLRRRRS